MTTTRIQKLPKQQWVILLTLGKYGAMSLQELVCFTSRLLPKSSDKQISSILDALTISGMVETTVMQYSILTDAGKSACMDFIEGCDNGMTPDQFYQTADDARLGDALSIARQHKSPLSFIPAIPRNRSNNYAN